MPAPSTCPKESWPPDYDAVYAWRRIQIAKFETNPRLLASAKEFYRNNPVAFINHWVDTYDPRNAGVPGKRTRMPLILFPRQAQMVDFVYGCLADDANGLEEKCRDMGATWVCCAISVHLWLFWEGAAIGWGSRKAELVDKIGDPKSIFEKLRELVRGLPRCFLPRGFDPRVHMGSMKLLNPEHGASVIGEVGDNIGRGGRTKIYFKDEAQPLDAKIMTPTGWQTMGEMSVGSIVTGADGKPCRVIGINDCGEHDVYRVRFCDGSETRCSENHLWPVEKFQGAKKMLTLRTAEIAASFDYLSPGGQRQYVYRVPVCSPVEFERGGDFPLHPYVVGALLGDGSVKHVQSSGVTLTSADPELITEVARLLPAGCVMRCDGEIGYRFVDERPRTVCNRWSKSRAREAVINSGIAGKGAVDKAVPSAYLYASSADRLAVLQGLMDTDGSASNGGFPTFHTSSEQLAEDVKFLIRSLGGKAPHAIKPDPRGYLDQHVIYVMLPEGTCPFRLSRKREALKVRKRVFKRTIVGIEKCGREIVRCITVDAPDGLYLTDDFIVTHNSAWYERPESIEAALSENTRVQIDISSVNGPNNVFHRKRESGTEWAPSAKIPRGTIRVFVLDVFDHPEKTKEWYDMRKREMTNQGLGHLFAQEVDRDYLAAVSGVIIPADWVRSCIDAHLKLNLDVGDNWNASLDVADDGISGDRNGLTLRQGIVLRSADEWGGVDPGVTANRAAQICSVLGSVDVQYDCIGVGAGVKSETNRLIREKKMPRGVRFIQWNAANKPLHPERRVVPNDKESPKNEDFFANLKAQGWWELSMRAYRTHMAVTQGQKFDPETLFSIDSKMRLFHTVIKELSQPVSDRNTNGKMVVDKTPEGTKSPNIGDSVMMNYFPMPGPMVISAEALNASRAPGGTMRRR